jgi:hypothetical protein
MFLKDCLCRLLNCRRRRPNFAFEVQYRDINLYTKCGKLTITLPKDKSCTVKIHPITFDDILARIDDLPNWSCSEEGIVRLDHSVDGLESKIIPIKEGTTILNVDATCDLKEGIIAVISNLTIKVI